MRWLTRYTQMLPSVVLSLALSGAVEGQQQASSPDGVARADRTVDLIERQRQQQQQQQQQQQPGFAAARGETGHASRKRTGPDQDAPSDTDNNDSSARRGKHLAAAAAATGGASRRLEDLAAPPGEARAATLGGGRVAGPPVRVELATAPSPFSPAPGGRGGSREPPSRRLQDEEACALGGDFTVSSTVYSAANGCYSIFVPGDPYTFASSTGFSLVAGDRMVLPSTELFNDGLPDTWIMAEVYDVSNAGALLSIECESDDLFVDGAHPSDVAAWTCFIGGTLRLVTADTFGMTCGCGVGSTTPPPAAPAPVDVESPEGDSGCGSTDPFAIVSPQLVELDGCYQDTGGDDGDTFFSQTGEKADGVLAVYPAPFDEEAFDLRWIVGAYSLAAEDTIVTCVSEGAPSDFHPADSTFFCDLTGTGAYTAVSEDQFSIVCGCDGGTTTAAPVRGVDSDTIAPSPAGFDETGGATPSPATGEETGTAADETNGAGGGAPAPRAWLPAASAAAAAVLMAAWVPQLAGLGGGSVLGTATGAAA